MDKNLNDRVNAYIIWLREESGFDWESIKDMVNSRYDVDLTRNAVRKRYGRRKSTYKDTVDDRNELLNKYLDDLGRFDAYSDFLEVEDNGAPEKVKNENVVEKTFQENGLNPDDFILQSGWIRGSGASLQIKRKKVSSDQLEELTEWARSYSPDYSAVKSSRPEGEHALLVSISDAHVGDVAWGSVRNAEEVYISTLKRIVSQALGQNFRISQIIFPFGNDMGAIDTPQDTTTAGTPQDTTTNFEGNYTMRKRIGITAIDFLSTVAPVHVPIVDGNHDQYLNFMLGEIFKVWFSDNNNVVIDNYAVQDEAGILVPAPRKYFQWGKNLLGFTHGDKEKEINYGAIMNDEQPEAFGGTEYREIIRGHWHGRKGTYIDIEDNFGIYVRTMPGLVPANQWHLLRGLFGRRRGGKAVVYSYDAPISEFDVFVG